MPIFDILKAAVAATDGYLHWIRIVDVYGQLSSILIQEERHRNASAFNTKSGGG
jgi:hypothetical protein